MGEDEAVFFHETLLRSGYLHSGECVSSGRWMKEPE
jgi:hypothetical protein